MAASQTSKWLTVFVAVAVVAAGGVAATFGAGWFSAFFGVPEVNDAARACLAVAGASMVGAVVAAINALLIHKTNQPMRLAIDPSWEPWLQAATAIAVGALTGTTIFR